MINRFEKIVNVIIVFLLIVAILLIISLFGIRLFSISPYVVVSGSMDPVYPVGSIVYVKDIPNDELKVGDDITFYLDQNSVATHRINKIYKDEKKVQTYGINNVDTNGNQINDARAVDFDKIVGKVQYSIPKLGFVYMFLRTISGKITILIIVLAMFAISKCLKYLEKEKRK